MARSTKLVGTVATDRQIVEVDLHNVVSNKSNRRAPSPALAAAGYGVFEVLTDEQAAQAGVKGDDWKQLPTLISLALSDDPVKQAEFIGLIDQYESESTDGPSITELAADMMTNGQLQNIGVACVDEGQYDIVFGCRRALARAYTHAKTAGKIPARLLSDVIEVKKGQGIYTAWSENFMRRNPSPMEQARFFKELKQQGMKINDIAESCNLDHQVVRLRLKLNQLKPEQQEKVHTGKLGVVKALKILEGKAAPDAEKPENRRRMPSLKQAEAIYGDLDGKGEVIKEFHGKQVTEEVRIWLAKLLQIKYKTREQLTEEAAAAAAAAAAQEAAAQETATEAVAS